jgi:hypothetical protein
MNYCVKRAFEIDTPIQCSNYYALNLKLLFVILIAEKLKEHELFDYRWAIIKKGKIGDAVV